MAALQPSDQIALRRQAEAAAAVYQGFNLAVYDSMVLGLNTRFTWRCPNQKIVDNYRACMTTNHLDIGIGTGYFLRQAGFPPGKIRLGLLDLSQASLDLSARHLSKFAPELYLANVLEPFDVKAPFDSVGINYVLHCLPGNMRSKRSVFENIRRVLNPGGVTFGATVLNGGVSHGWLARKMLPSLNQKGIFCNLDDDLAGLKDALSRVYSTHSIEIVGSVAVFHARL